MFIFPGIDQLCNPGRLRPIAKDKYSSLQKTASQSYPEGSTSYRYAD